MRLIRVARQKMHRDAPNFRALAAPFAAVPLVVAKVASSVVQSAVSEVPACFAVVRLRSAQFAAVPLAAICLLEVASACPNRWAAFEGLSS
jgi:hypothetical protein